MLGVAGEQFPKSGALGMGLLGGVGMLSAGLLGSPGIGYKQDRAASNYLKGNPQYAQVYERYKAEGENRFLFFKPITGLDGSKVAVLQDNGAQLATDIQNLQKAGKKLSDDKNLSQLNGWWLGRDEKATEAVAGAAEKLKGDDAAKAEAAARAAVPDPSRLGAKAYAAEDRPAILNANIYGGQRALKITAGVPVTMAVCYLLLVLYYVAKGGYKQIHLTGEQVSGGVEGPME
jgi:hypothetical protein